MNISINIQSSVRIDTDRVIYFDPYRIEKENNDADIIFITHKHSDHFSPASIAEVANADTVFVAPASMLQALIDEGISEDKIVALRPFDEAAVLGYRVSAVPAYNTNKPMHKREYGWLGYVVEIEGKRIYAAGDIDAIDEGAALDVDIALVPIGGTYTMDYAEAAEFVNRMKPRMVIPYHYGRIVGRYEDGEAFSRLVDDDIEVKIILKNL